MESPGPVTAPSLTVALDGTDGDQVSGPQSAVSVLGTVLPPAGSLVTHSQRYLSTSERGRRKVMVALPLASVLKVPSGRGAPLRPSHASYVRPEPALGIFHTVSLIAELPSPCGRTFAD